METVAAVRKTRRAAGPGWAPARQAGAIGGSWTVLEQGLDGIGLGSAAASREGAEPAHLAA
eukprot:2574218-Rhodomonas_salina.1